VRRHNKKEVTDLSNVPDPVDTFLAQAPFIEKDGVDDAAVQREELVHGGPDADAISTSIELMNQHHELR
jgi:hypothetical protein